MSGIHGVSLEGLESMPPGPELAAALATVDLSTYGSAQLLLVSSLRATQIAYDQAQLLHVMLETAYAERAEAARRKRRPRLSEAELATPVRQRLGDFDEFCADQLAFQLTWPRSTAFGQVLLARDLIERIPAVFAALQTGRIDLQRAQAFSESLSGLDDPTARSLAERFINKAEGWTAGTLRERLRYHVLKADPGLARKRYEWSVSDRKISHRPFTDGTSQLGGVNLPPHLAAAAYNRIDRMARAARSAGDPRTLQQLRADAFLDVLSGRPFMLTPGLDDLTAAADQAARNLGYTTEHPDDTATTPPPTPVYRAGTTKPRTQNDTPADSKTGKNAGSGTGRTGTGTHDRYRNRTMDETRNGTKSGDGNGNGTHNDSGAQGENWGHDRGGTESGKATAGRGAANNATGGGGDGRRRLSDQDNHERGMAGDGEPIGAATFGSDAPPGADEPPDWEAGDPVGSPGRAEGESPPRTPKPEPDTDDDGDDAAEAAAAAAAVPVASDDPRMCVCGGVQPAPRRGVVDLHIPMSTLMCLSEDPGVIPGWGPIIADIARLVAHDQETNPTWMYSVTDHNGNLMHHGPIRRRPTAAEKAFVKARDKTCRAPGCRQPATSCDDDHQQEWANNGPSHRQNLCVLCRHHHRLRHERGFVIHNISNGLGMWEAPNGMFYIVLPDATLIPVDGHEPGPPPGYVNEAFGNPPLEDAYGRP